MNRPTLYRKRLALLSAFMFAASLSPGARAQDLVVPPQPAPPPMVYIPHEARTQLLSARDEKARTRLSLELAEARLARAEQQTELKQFNAATADLGVYQALMEDALQHLYRTGHSSSGSRDLIKRIEQSLHKHLARIEAMRRATPGEFAGNLRAMVQLVRDLRTEALESFYGDTIM
jgi:chromosome segregation ATPase